VLDDSNLDVEEHLDGEDDGKKQDEMQKTKDKQQSNIMLDTYYNA
jgi:hypothetical protein